MSGVFVDSQLLRKALVPISLNNDVFSTRVVVPAVAAIASDFDQVLIAIADETQFYNRVARFDTSHQAPDFGAIETSVAKTSRDRSRWFDHLRHRLLPFVSRKTELRFLRLTDVMDEHTFRIFRRILVLYDTNRLFQRDVDAAAETYVLSRRTEKGTPDLPLQVQMSRRYILEEAAMSIRIRVPDRIGYEFYIGPTLPPIANIYLNLYGATPWTLAGVPKADFEFRFYEYVRGPNLGFKWVDYATRSPYVNRSL